MGQKKKDRHECVVVTLAYGRKDGWGRRNLDRVQPALCFCRLRSPSTSLPVTLLLSDILLYWVGSFSRQRYLFP